jgi:hypothetical protein
MILFVLLLFLVYYWLMDYNSAKEISKDFDKDPKSTIKYLFIWAIFGIVFLYAISYLEGKFPTKTTSQNSPCITDPDIYNNDIGLKSKTEPCLQNARVHDNKIGIQIGG